MSWHRIEHLDGGHLKDAYVVCPACWPEHGIRPVRQHSMRGQLRETAVKPIAPPTGDACHWCEQEAA